MVTKKITSLSKIEERVIASAAMFPENFFIDWLVELTGEKVRLILAAMQKSVESGWVNQQEVGVFKFKKLPDRYSEYFSPSEQEQLHIRIADILTKEYNQGTIDIRGLVYHLLRVHNDLKRCMLLVEAGDAYLKLYQNEQALQCFKKVTDDLSDESGYDADLLFIQATLKYSRISTARHHNKMVSALLKSAINRAKRQNQSQYIALLQMHLAKNDWLGSRYEGALANFEKGWVLAKKLEDPKLMRSATTFSTFFLYWQGRFKEAVNNFENPIQNIDNFLEARFPIIAATTVAQCYAFMGNVREALGMLDTTFNHCMQKGDISLAANVEGTIGSIMLQIRHLDDALKYFNGSLEKAVKKENYFLQILLKCSLAYSYFILEDYKRAIKYLTDFLNQSEKVNVTVQVYPYLMEMALAMHTGKMKHIKGVSAEAEIKKNIDGKNVFLKGLAYRYQAQFFLKDNHTTQDVIDSLVNSIEYLEESGHKIETAISQLELGRQYMLMNMDDQAKLFLRVGSDALIDLGDAVIPPNIRPLLTKSKPEGNLRNEIVKLGQDIMTFKDHSQLIQHTIGTVNRLTGAERGGIFLVREKGDGPSLYLKGSKNITIEHIKHEQFIPSMKLIKKALNSKKALIKEFKQNSAKDNLSYGRIRSCICIPMILQNSVIGVLYNDNRLIERSFKKSNVDLLTYFASFAALALDSAMIHDKIKHIKKNHPQKSQAIKAPIKHHFRFGDIVGNSAPISNVLSKVSLVSRTDSTVLILGETGVGKELVADAIHRQSKRNDKPIIRVICNAFPNNLISSELFGHEKGSFTGADRLRVGRFELADGGTIFLDEIGELPYEIQVQLLRVLQTREFERIGSSKTIRSDFRLILATNRNLEKEVNAGRFRSDLYYRISGFPIVIPPLRDRKDDIIQLSYHFLEVFSERFGKNIDFISDTELDKLMAYDWPGNVRELENTIEQGVIMSSENNFQVPESITLRHPPSTTYPGHFTLKENERAHIVSALQKTGWKVRGKGGAAELLDIHPSTLHFRIKKHGIERPKNIVVRRVRNIA